MCGITGIWNESSESIIRKMTDAVAHRGPDGLAYKLIGNHSLGASRLAIVGNPEASAIHQDSQTGLVVLFNGEIYNVVKLRRELQAKGAVFTSDLEAEVLAKLYASDGPAFAARLKGMFAIAILDDDRIVLARDRFGIKPLYYADLNGRLAFGSEIKAVLAHPEVRVELNRDALEEIVVFGYVYSPAETPFRAVLQVEPGTVMVFDHCGKSIHSFGEIPRAKYLHEGLHPDYPSSVAQVRERIINTVQLLFEHGNQPKGLYLSGGLDSTTLAIVVREILGYPLTTFTLADSPDNDDFVAAGKVAKRLGTKHVERIINSDDYFAVLEDFVRNYETPVAGGVFDLHGAMAFHLLTETVAQHVKVAFSGEGADELFGGYYWIYTHPLGFADRIRNRVSAFPIGPKVRHEVKGLFPLPEHELTYRRKTLDALLRSGLANYHLQSVDRSCSAFGFEIRPAYLYDDLADLALSLPIEYKVPDKTTTKRILRDAFLPEFERLGLEWVLTRLKDGMPAAVSNIASTIRAKMESEVSDASLLEHPLRVYFGSKMDVYLFDLFATTFQLESNYAVQYRVPQ